LFRSHQWKQHSALSWITIRATFTSISIWEIFSHPEASSLHDVKPPKKCCRLHCVSVACRLVQSATVRDLHSHRLGNKWNENVLSQWPSSCSGSGLTRIRTFFAPFWGQMQAALIRMLRFGATQWQAVSGSAHSDRSYPLPGHHKSVCGTRYIGRTRYCGTEQTSWEANHSASQEILCLWRSSVQRTLQLAQFRDTSSHSKLHHSVSWRSILASGIWNRWLDLVLNNQGVRVQV
jgi:hypothetical protein